MLNSFFAWLDAQPAWAVELVVMLWMAAMFALVHIYEQCSHRDSSKKEKKHDHNQR